MSRKNPRADFRKRMINGLPVPGILLVAASLAGLIATAMSGLVPRILSAAPWTLSTAPSEAGLGLRPEWIHGKYGYVDEAGKVVIAPRFDGADAFSEGLAVVLDSGRFGYIDCRGAFAIPAVYGHARAFQHGFAPVRFDGTWLFIDRGGKPVNGPIALDE